GVATQDPYRQKALDVPSKAERVASFHKNTLKSLASIVGAVGLQHPSQLQPYHIARRLDDGQIKLLSKYFYFTDKDALLDHSARADVFNQMWVMASPDSFLANNDALIAYNKDSRDKGKETSAPTERSIATGNFENIVDGGRLIGNVNNTFREFPPNND
ncbi:MAG: FMN-binding glutamate synthase family protein, partial [Psychrobacter alimentarius]